MKINVPADIWGLMDVIEIAGGRPFIVGGFVRDSLLGLPCKDIDIEVFGMEFDKLHALLRRLYDKVDLVGESFGVIKINNEIDISIPRRENNVGIGHKDFEIMTDPNMTFKEAASRRDFTINSMGCDKDGEIVDPFGGIEDLKRKVLKATSGHFKEDALRVLRAMQFAARFEMEMDTDTTFMCQDMFDGFRALPKERLWTEWEKICHKARNFSYAIDTLKRAGWLVLFHEIGDMDLLPQDPSWHPEGDCLAHTIHVVNAAINIANRENLVGDERTILIMAAICHDMGKVSTTTKNEEGRWVAPGHAEAGVPVAKSFLNSINAPNAIIDPVLVLVKEHMAHVGALKSQGEDVVTDRMVRRLANRLKPHTNVKMWGWIVEADHSGRPPLPASSPVLEWLRIADELAIKESAPKPLVKGDHLLAIGYKQGKEMGDILRSLFERQLDGEFSTLEEGLKLVPQRAEVCL